MPVLQVAAALARAFSHHENFMIDIAAKSAYLVAGDGYGLRLGQ